ncbi:hypothetical protein HNR69_001049 [Histophilus somni]|nr:hypothetical protein [Histophilus somni]
MLIVVEKKDLLGSDFALKHILLMCGRGVGSAAIFGSDD